MTGTEIKSGNNTIENRELRRLSAEICSRLKQQKICVCGQNTWTTELLLNSLRYLNEQNHLELSIMEEGENPEFSVREQKGGLVLVTGELSESGSKCLEQLDGQMKLMEMIQKTEPEAVVYLSDSRVYGKSFGPQGSRREDELGYVCHTAITEMDCQSMRMAEHVVCRMAKEQNLPAKVVRLPKKPEAEELYQIMPYILGVMLNGENGEIYNIAVEEYRTAEQNSRDVLVWTEKRSPLTAMEIRMNTEKVRNYVASGLFE